MRELARLHAPLIGDPVLENTDWLNPSRADRPVVGDSAAGCGFFERYDERIAPEHRTVCQRLVDSLDGWMAERHPPLGLVHGDFRLDNLLFGDPAGEKPLTVVDWQTVGWGDAMSDVSYFLGGGLALSRTGGPTSESWWASTTPALRALGGEVALNWDECWEGYRRHSFAGVLMAIVASMLVERTERGDEIPGDHAGSSRLSTSWTWMRWISSPPRARDAQPRRPRARG